MKVSKLLKLVFFTAVGIIFLTSIVLGEIFSADLSRATVDSFNLVSALKYSSGFSLICGLYMVLLTTDEPDFRLVEQGGMYFVERRIFLYVYWKCGTGDYCQLSAEKYMREKIRELEAKCSPKRVVSKSHISESM